MMVTVNSGLGRPPPPPATSLWTSCRCSNCCWKAARRRTAVGEEGEGGNSPRRRRKDAADCWTRSPHRLPITTAAMVITPRRRQASTIWSRFGLLALRFQVCFICSNYVSSMFHPICICLCFLCVFVTCRSVHERKPFVSVISDVRTLHANLEIFPSCIRKSIFTKLLYI